MRVADHHAEWRSNDRNENAREIAASISFGSLFHTHSLRPLMSTGPPVGGAGARLIATAHSTETIGKVGAVDLASFVRIDLASHRCARKLSPESLARPVAMFFPVCRAVMLAFAFSSIRFSAISRRLSAATQPVCVQIRIPHPVWTYDSKWRQCGRWCSDGWRSRRHGYHRHHRRLRSNPSSDPNLSRFSKVTLATRCLLVS